jgi:hypothetical protein
VLTVWTFAVSVIVEPGKWEEGWVVRSVQQLVARMQHCTVDDVAGAAGGVGFGVARSTRPPCGQVRVSSRRV